MNIPADSQWGFDKSAALAERFIWLSETGSTNDDAAALARNAADPAPAYTVVVTDSQTAGRGRLGRTWVASSGKTLAISVLVRPESLFATPDSLAWLPLISGISMTRAVQAELDALRELHADEDEYAPEQAIARLKWPNDVLINGFKVSGILTELLADQQAVVIGSGLNLTLDEHDLPTLTSTSLMLAAGAQPDADRVLAHYLTGLRARIETLVQHAGNADAAGLLAEVTELCGTLGAAVRVDLPAEQELTGVAESIDTSGRLLVRAHSGELHAIAAGDVTHLRLDA